jgi:hypothetical protein
MPDFIRAFQRGQELAKAAEASRKEIDSVFLDLNSQIGKATDGKVTLKREQFDEPLENPMEALSFKPRQKYWAITARHSNNATVGPFVLARWLESPAGYPCRIVLRGETTFCENKAGLEAALTALLSDAAVGEFLYKIVQTA